MTRLFWAVICSGTYLQHRVYLFADEQRKMAKPNYTPIALIALVVTAAVVGAFVWSMIAGID